MHILYAYISQNNFAKNAFVYMILIYKPTCTTHARTAKKKPRRSSLRRSSSLQIKVSNGSMLYSLGMTGGTVKKPRKSTKSPRRSVSKKSPRIKAKRVSKRIVRKKSRAKKPAGGRPCPHSYPQRNHKPSPSLSSTHYHHHHHQTSLRTLNAHKLPTRRRKRPGQARFVSGRVGLWVYE